MEGTPLLDVMRGLILEPEAQADFAADPSGYMQRFGYDDVPQEDLREAVGLVADTLPPDVAHAVNTAADAEPTDDAYGEGTVGLLGRLSTVEVTESVVPELDDLPEVPTDDGGLADDGLADDHDATTFGDVTRDFDDGGDSDADAGEAGEAGEDTGGLADATGPDVSFGDAGFDDAGSDADLGGEAAADPVTPSPSFVPEPDAAVPLEGGGAEAFGQGSAEAGADASFHDDSFADESFADDSFAGSYDPGGLDLAGGSPVESPLDDAGDADPGIHDAYDGSAGDDGIDADTDLGPDGAAGSDVGDF